MIPRRSKIRPPRKTLVSEATVDYSQSWQILASAIKQIQLKNVSSLSYEQLYRKAYTLVSRKYGPRLYEDVSNSIHSHLLSRRDYLLQISDLDEFLRSLLLEWDDHLQCTKYIADIMLYLDRVYVKDAKKLLVNDLGIVIFKKSLLLTGTVKSVNDSLGSDKRVKSDLEADLRVKDLEADPRVKDSLEADPMAKDSLDADLRVQSNLGAQRANNVMEAGKRIKIEDSSDQGFEVSLESNQRSNRGLEFIENLGVSLNLSQPSIGERVTSILISEYTKSRKGILINKTYISKVIQMLELLIDQDENYYQSHFEPVFMEASKLFFKEFVDSLPNDGLIHLDFISELITQEESRMHSFLPQSSHGKLINLLNNALIKTNIDEILQYPVHGLTYLLEPNISNVLQNTNQIDHLPYLKLIYQLVGRIDNTYQLLRLRLKDAIISQGSIITDYIRSSEPKSIAFATSWLNSSLNYKDQFNTILTECFDSSPVIEQTITFAMRDFINNPKLANAPEILSIYIDFNIKQINKSTLTVNELLNKSISFLKFVKDKDSFEAHYANHFAKRFLNSKSNLVTKKLDINIEELLISKLCEEMGISSMDKIIKMNKDIKTSKDTTQNWKTQNEGIDIDLDLKICNVLDWPKSMTKDYKSFDNELGFIWSSQLRPTIKKFENFWTQNNKNSNKSLYWSPKFGSIDLKVTYPSKTYEINLATYAGIIMLLFAPQSRDANGDLSDAFKEDRELTYEEIKELTGIPENDLKRHLQSIAVAPRSRLLIKVPMTKEVNNNDKFKLNVKFKSPSIKVKVLTVSASSKKEKTEQEIENEAVKQDVSEGRKIEVNAAIVRIMKSRRSLKHNELIEELVKQLINRFQPPMILVKQQITDLIEKEYLKRDDDNKSVYHYLA